MLVRSAPTTLSIWFDGQEILAREGDSVAVALLAAGITATRITAISGTPRMTSLKLRKDRIEGFERFGGFARFSTRFKGGIVLWNAGV